MKTSKVLKKIECEMRAEAQRLGDIWLKGGGTNGSIYTQEQLHVAHGWDAAAALVKRYRKSFAEIELLEGKS